MRIPYLAQLKTISFSRISWNSYEILVEQNEFLYTIKWNTCVRIKVAARFYPQKKIEIIMATDLEPILKINFPVAETPKMRTLISHSCAFASPLFLVCPLLSRCVIFKGRWGYCNIEQNICEDWWWPQLACLRKHSYLWWFQYSAWGVVSPPKHNRWRLSSLMSWHPNYG